MIYISLWIDCLFEIRKTAVCFLLFSLPGDYRVTDEALLADDQPSFLWMCSLLLKNLISDFMKVYLCKQEYATAMTSWPIFHGPLTLDFVQIIKVKIFVQGRILGSTNGSKLIFYMSMILYKTSWKIQDHNLHFTVCWL